MSSEVLAALQAALDALDRISETALRRPAPRGLATVHVINEVHLPDEVCDLCRARTLVEDALQEIG